MAGIFTKRIWQPYICQPNELKREINKKTGKATRGAKQKSGGAMAHPGPPLRIAIAADKETFWTPHPQKTRGVQTPLFVHLWLVYIRSV